MQSCGWSSRGSAESELEAVDRVLADLTARYDVAVAEREELGARLQPPGRTRARRGHPGA